jgi:GNAT superfamily N-acetyltransferase
MSASSLFTVLSTAKRSEYAEVIHLSRQAEVCRRLFPEQDVLIQPVPGGIAIRTLPIFLGKLNRVLGLGMEGKVLDEDLCNLESIFASIGLCPEIHLCPFADQSALQSLASCRYVVKGFLNTYACSLKDSAVEIDHRKPKFAAGLVISRAAAGHEAERFIQASIAGFEDGGRSPEILRVLAEIATLRQDTRLYFATVDNEIAGTAALAVLDTPHGSVAHLYSDSTLPKYRGKGIHAALIQARLSDAKQLGLDFVTTITRVGGGSARNAERAGFRLAYTKAIFTQ